MKVRPYSPAPPLAACAPALCQSTFWYLAELGILDQELLGSVPSRPHADEESVLACDN